MDEVIENIVKKDNADSSNNSNNENSNINNNIINNSNTNSSNNRDEFFRKVHEMFEHRTKLSKMVGEKVIDNYKHTYFYLFEKIQKGELPTLDDYYGGNELAENIYRRKYYLKDLDDNKTIEEKAEDVFMRIAAHVASVEETDDLREKYAEEFYKDLFEGYYLPGGRVIAGAGDLYRLKTLANCFVSVISEDNLESIYKASYEAARTYSYGGGIGIDVSQLRPKNSKVHNAADQSTGAVSFMELYSMTTGLIGQSGRRGALMLTIDIKHPDVVDFINVKKEPNWVTNQIMDRLKFGNLKQDQLENIQKNIIENTQVRFANTSIKVSDEFMAAVDEQNTYGKNQILVYSKKEKTGPVDGPSSDNVNYTYGISKKDLKKYELIEEFSTIEELNSYLIQNGFKTVEKKNLDSVDNRDFYGDYVLECESCDYDLAIRYSGDYMTYYKSKSVGEIKVLYKARDIWNKFIEANYKTAEPGLIFWSQMSKYSPSNYIGKPIACTNPCGEVPLEDGGACNLGSINLSRMVKYGYSENAVIDWELLANTTRNLVRFLDNVVWWNETLNALEKQRDAAKSTRRLGVGVMGIADMFNQLAINYDSAEALALLEKVLNHIAQSAYKTSALLAKEKGKAPAFELEGYIKNPFFKEIITDEIKDMIKEYGLRNIALLSIAPTGTISNAITGFRTEKKNYIGISGGIEPIFALYYTRRSEQMNQGALYNVFHNTVQAYIDIKGLTQKARDCNEESLKEILPIYFFRTAHHISPDMRVKFQGSAQKYIDHSISSTVNLSEDIEPETISDIYMKSWKQGLKGITIYRDGSRYPVLSVEGEETEFQRFRDKKFIIKNGKDEIEVRGDEILVTPTGRLTTIYHGKKGGEF